MCVFRKYTSNDMTYFSECQMRLKQEKITKNNHDSSL